MHILSAHETAGSSALHRADARLKLAVGLILVVMVLCYQGFVFPLLIALSSLILTVIHRVPLRRVILRFSEPLFIAAVLVLLKTFFSGSDGMGTVPLFGLEITAYRDGLREGLLIATRIVGAVSIVAILGIITPFNEFLSALAWFRVPKGFIEVLMFAYRYIFLLFEEAMVIYHAQKNRLGYSSIRRGLNSFGVLAGSLTLKAFDNSSNTATAMAQRGYDGSMPMLRHRPFRMVEVVFSVVLVAVMGALWSL